MLSVGCYLAAGLAWASARCVDILDMRTQLINMATTPSPNDPLAKVPVGDNTSSTLSPEASEAAMEVMLPSHIQSCFSSIKINPFAFCIMSYGSIATVLLRSAPYLAVECLCWPLALARCVLSMIHYARNKATIDQMMSRRPIGKFIYLGWSGVEYKAFNPRFRKLPNEEKAE